MKNQNATYNLTNVPVSPLSPRRPCLPVPVSRTHSEAGYNILKKINFPWPIARIVLQHHERMDGSGYPSGLSEQEILLEARIIAVADVMEAMSTHRPYRASLSIEMALEEIEAKRGLLYDKDVAEVCLQLFRSGKFQFETE